MRAVPCASSVRRRDTAGASDVGGPSLAIAVEKDFACIDRSDADNTDTFPNPHEGAVC